MLHSGPTPTPENETLRVIENAYGSRLTEEMQNYLVHEYVLQDCHLGNISPQAAVHKLSKIFPLLHPEPAPIHPFEINLSAVSSGILAMQAERESRVEMFRTEVLDGVLLKPTSIESWVNKIGRQEGPSSKWLAGPPGSTRVVGYELRFETPDRAVTGIYVAIDGILDKLRDLSIFLSHKYGWKQEKVVTLVMAGVIPRVDSIQVGTEIYSETHSRSRVILSIDPTLPPEDVSRAYMWAREQWFQKGRGLSSKHQCLALFYARYWVFADQPRPGQRVLRDKWNQMCRSEPMWEVNWVYDKANSVRQFMRDGKVAYAKIVAGRQYKGRS